jgi:hypothetical protein
MGAVEVEIQSHSAALILLPSKMGGLNIHRFTLRQAGRKLLLDPSSCHAAFRCSAVLNLLLSSFYCSWLFRLMDSPNMMTHSINQNGNAFGAHGIPGKAAPVVLLHLAWESFLPIFA